jgi:hypothetical protein
MKNPQLTVHLVVKDRKFLFNIVVEVPDRAMRQEK